MKRASWNRRGEPRLRTEPAPACPVCGDVRREVLYERLVDRLYGAAGTWRLQRCLGCSAAYLDPRPTAQAIAAAYEAYYTHEATPRTAERGRLRKLRQALRNGYLNARFDYALRPATGLGRFVVPLFPRQRAAAVRHVRGLARPHERARLLDVGCGNGEFLLEMRAARWSVQGLEADAEAVARAREHALDVREGILESGSFPAGSFDAITLSHVLEHVPEPAAALRACRELLRDEGVLWIATPNLSSPGHARFGRAWRGLEPPRHLVLFTPSALARSLEGSGFGPPSFLRPASARWVYEASGRLSRGAGPSRHHVLLADVRSGVDHRLGEELVAIARPK